MGRAQAREHAPANDQSDATPGNDAANEEQQRQAAEQAQAEEQARQQAAAEQPEQTQRDAPPAPNDQSVSTPGSHDQAVTLASNPSTEQVTQQGGEAVESEGQRIREQAQRDAEERAAVSPSVSLDQALHETDPGISYNDTGALVNRDGKRIAMSADATDPDVGWTVQHAGAHRDEGDRVVYPGGYATVPDQTVHPDELPDPLAAVRAGLLPQNTEVLNVDPAKFEGKKSLEP